MPPEDEKPEGEKKRSEPIIIDLGDCFFSDAPSQMPNAMNLGKAAQDRKASKELTRPGAAATAATPMDARYDVLEKSASFLADPFGTNASNAIIAPPYPLQKLANLSEISVVRSTCIRAIAQNTVGLGYDIKKLDPTAEGQDTDHVATQVRRTLEKWCSRDDSTFTELLYKVKIDEESMGNGYIEVSRKMNGQIDGFWHVPAATVRVLTSQYTDSDRYEGIPVRPSYVQIKGDREIPFYRFGDKSTIDEKGIHHYREGAQQNINELIHFKLYPSKSDDYGSPRDISAIVTIAGDEMARNHNIKYFTNAATPEMAIVFEIDTKAFPQIAGDQPVKVSIPEPMKRQIIKHFREGLSSPNFQPGIFYLPAGISVRFEQLSKGQTDSGWTKYRQSAADEIRMAFQVPSIVIGDESKGAGGYANAIGAKAEFLEQVIAPEQHRYSQRIMNRIWPELVTVQAETVPPTIDVSGDLTVPDQIDITPDDGTGVNPDVWVLEFKTMSTSDKTVDANANNIYGALGVLDINEIRQSIGLPPKPDGDHPPVIQTRGGNTVGPGLPDPSDTRGMAGTSPSTGRSAAGAVNGGSPRRPGDLATTIPANFATAGVAKSSEEVSKALGEEVEFEHEAEFEYEAENEELPTGIRNIDPESLDFDAERYFQKIEEGFNLAANKSAQNEPEIEDEDDESPDSE